MGEKKLARKARRADFEFHGHAFNSLVCLRFHVYPASPDDAHAARRKYKKEVD